MKNELEQVLPQTETKQDDASWFFTKFSYYLLATVAIGSAFVLAMLYVYLWWTLGFWATLGILTLLILARWSTGQIVDNPHTLAEYPKLLTATKYTNEGLVYVTQKMGVLHAMHGKFIKAVGFRVMQLPTKWKVSIAVVSSVIFLSTSLFVSWKTVTVVKAKLPYGKERFTMSPEQLAERKLNRVKQAMFAVWGKEGAANSAQCMEQYKTLIYTEARKNGITPERFEGLLFVESFCNPKQINESSGAAGIGQIMLSVGCERGLVMDKAFCVQVLASEGKIKFIPKDKNIEDRRLYPQYAIPVSAQILGEGKIYWGDENWAFVEYHMGIGNLRKLVIIYFDETANGWRTKYPAKFNQKQDPNNSVPAEIKVRGITFDDIFFRCTPIDTPKTYKLLFSLSDSSATYVYTGLAATEGFALMRSDNKAFIAMVADQQDPDGGTANRPKRAWWSDKDAKYNTLADIKAAISAGTLVPVPDDPKYGFVLRTSGADRIGECDAANAASYYYTRKATVGLMFLMMSRTMELGADTLEATGLIRTNEMYDKPVKKNGNGCLPKTQPRPHVIGVAFDVGANIKGKPMSKKTRDAWEFVIMDLRADGVIDRTKEGIADHIDYNPAFEKELEEIYYRVVGGNSPLPAESPF